MTRVEDDDFHFLEALAELRTTDAHRFDRVYENLQGRAGELASRIVAAARTVREPELRIRLAELLGETGVPGLAAGAIEVLRDFLGASDSRLRSTAAHSLICLDTEESLRLANTYYQTSDGGRPPNEGV